MGRTRHSPCTQVERLPFSQADVRQLSARRGITTDAGRLQKAVLWNKAGVQRNRPEWRLAPTADIRQKRITDRERANEV